MKQKAYLFTIWMTALLMLSCGQEKVPKKNSFEIKNGLNVGHWLSLSQHRGERRKAYFTRTDVEYIAGLGYDHIRLPIDEVSSPRAPESSSIQL